MSRAALQITSTVRLNTGYHMPILGFGVAYGFDKPVDTRVVTKPSVLEAFKAGYRHIDTARFYDNEAQVGEAVRESGLKREDMFVTTKIHSGLHGYKRAQATVQDSLTALGFDYIDLYLIHDANSGQKLRLETYKALLEAKTQGYIRSVGVSNYGVKHLEEIENAGYERPAVNQIELHPLCQQRPIVKYCKEKGIIVQAYCPIIRGRMDHPVIIELSQKYNKDPAQILLRWSLQHGFVPLPKSSQPARIHSNAQVFDFELTEADVGLLDSLDKGKAGAISWNPVDVA
ncbi:Aldo/keto reductase [Pilatotrama ljubarskyi]|nr:Aldo/keto reductase [Pilatotrama ljubarskyi]